MTITEEGSTLLDNCPPVITTTQTVYCGLHSPIYHKCGTQNRTRFVEIGKLAWSLGDSIRDSLIGLHAFTCYDTVSAFASRRKLSALKPMKTYITYLETFSQVGQSWEVKQFTCRMYVAASSTTEVNELR